MAQNIRNRTVITEPRILTLIEECVTNTKNMGFALPESLRFLERKNAKRVAGTAYTRQKVIALSEFIYKEKDSAIKAVIYHELAHIIAGPGVGHGPVWKNIVGKMTKTTGIKITRLYSDEDMPVHAAEVGKLWKYAFRCKGCGSTIHYFKATKFCKTYDQLLLSGKPRWTCTKCGGTFEKIK